MARFDVAGRQVEGATFADAVRKAGLPLWADALEGKRPLTKEIQRGLGVNFVITADGDIVDAASGYSPVIRPRLMEDPSGRFGPPVNAGVVAGQENRIGNSATRPVTLFNQGLVSAESAILDMTRYQLQLAQRRGWSRTVDEAQEQAIQVFDSSSQRGTFEGNTTESTGKEFHPAFLQGLEVSQIANLNLNGAGSAVPQNFKTFTQLEEESSRLAAEAKRKARAEAEARLRLESEADEGVLGDIPGLTPFEPGRTFPQTQRPAPAAAAGGQGPVGAPGTQGAPRQQSGATSATGQAILNQLLNSLASGTMTPATGSQTPAFGLISASLAARGTGAAGATPQGNIPPTISQDVIDNLLNGLATGTVTEDNARQALSLAGLQPGTIDLVIHQALLGGAATPASNGSAADEARQAGGGGGQPPMAQFLERDGRLFIRQPDGSITEVGLAPDAFSVQEFQQEGLATGPDGRLFFRGSPADPFEALPQQAAPTIDQQIDQAIIDGDFGRATALANFQTRPDRMDLFDAAIRLAPTNQDRLSLFNAAVQYAQSPADQFVISNIARGALPLETIQQQFPEGGVRRLGPPPALLQQAFGNLFQAPGAELAGLLGFNPVQDAFTGLRDQVTGDPFATLRNGPRAATAGEVAGRSMAASGNQPTAVQEVNPRQLWNNAAPANPGVNPALIAGGPLTLPLVGPEQRRLIGDASRRSRERNQAALAGAGAATPGLSPAASGLPASAPPAPGTIGVEVNPRMGPAAGGPGQAPLGARPGGNGGLQLPAALEQLLAGQVIRQPASLFSAAGIRTPSAQALRRLTPTELGALQGLARTAGIPDAEIQRELGSATPLGGQFRLGRNPIRAARI